MLESIPIALWALFALSPATRDEPKPLDDPKPLLERVQHAYARNGDVKIHYVELGQGPLIVMLHGFPDYWYTWRHQMEALSKTHRVVAVDLRGYNKSDKPKGVAPYSLTELTSDVLAVIKACGEESAIIVGHDWGGAIAWTLAMRAPKAVRSLIVCNLPHPKGLMREMENNPKQREASQYARNFQKQGAEKALSARALAGWVKDKDARQHYIEAFERSDLRAMLAYYKANFPRTEANANPSDQPRETPLASTSSYPKIKASTLVIFGLQDKALLPAGLNGTWDWIEKDLTLVTIPQAGHFVQQDAADMVTRSMVMWLGR